MLRASTSCTCGRSTAWNSCLRCIFSAGCAGTRRSKPSPAIRPMGTNAQKAKRHPNAWPNAVPAGTPSTLASVSPVNMSAIAWARSERGTRCAATMLPMPKNAPWQSAVRMRASRSSRKVGANAHRALPATNIPIRISSARLRSMCDRARATSGDPSVTLSAYPDTRIPVFGLLTRKL